MTGLYALLDPAGVVRQVTFSDVKRDGFTTYALPDGFWIGDVRLPNGTWQHPAVPAATPVQSDAERIADLEARLAALDGGGV